jgi:surface polysaccharide O-acyltransferase-like enzyme
VAGLSLPAALLLPIRSNQLLHSFTHVSLGVYASHPFVFLGLQSLVSARSVSVWFAVPAVFIGAVVFSTLLRKVPWGKAIV